jgi:hypothetical protein
MTIVTLRRRVDRLNGSVPERPLNCTVCGRAFPFERIVYPDHVEYPEGR